MRSVIIDNPSAIQRELDSIVTSKSIFFFDMDGTLVDTNYANFLSYQKAIELVTKSNLDISYRAGCRFNRSALKKAIPNLTDAQLAMIIYEKERCQNDFLRETQLNNELAEILIKYSNTNKTVLVTNCRKDRALATLKYHGLTDKFSDLFFREFDNLRVNKFQNAITALKISPKLIIVFENEEEEIENALGADIEHINPILS